MWIGRRVSPPAGPLPSMGCPSMLNMRPSASSPTGTAIGAPWVVSWLQEVIQRYQPDGILLDYMRYSSLPTKLDPVSAAREIEWSKTVDATESGHQQFRELTEQQVRALGKAVHILYDIKYTLPPNAADLRL